MIISRYLQKEVLHTVLGVALVLLLVLLSNQLVRYLSFAAMGKIASHYLMQLMGFEIPYLLALLLPLSLFLGIILTYGRLYADSEIPVLNACGFSNKRLLKVTTSLAFVMMICVAVLTFWINPLIAQKQARILAQGMAQDSVLDTVTSGRFQVTSDGRRVIYVEKISRNHQAAQNIFFAQQGEKPGSGWVVVSAASGSQVKDPNSQERFILATHGNRYEGIPGQNDYKIIQFEKYFMHIPHMSIPNRKIQETMPTNKLWRNYQNPDAAAELQWRMALPVSVILLTLLAVPLSYVKPRQSRYAAIFPAILIYVIYMNLLFVGRSWIEQKSMSSSVGLWWVHVILLGVLIVLFSLRHLHRRLFKRRYL